jgi:hypothetical protein
MKNTIKWHQECLSNRKRSHVELKNKISMLTQRLFEIKLENEFYQRQIEGAIKQEKVDFDRDHFMIPKKDKTK